MRPASLGPILENVKRLFAVIADLVPRRQGNVGSARQLALLARPRARPGPVL